MPDVASSSLFSFHVVQEHHQGILIATNETTDSSWSTSEPIMADCDPGSLKKLKNQAGRY